MSLFTSCRTKLSWRSILDQFCSDTDPENGIKRFLIFRALSSSRRKDSGYSLIGFHHLVQSHQTSVPAAAVWSLQVHADFVHNGRPAARKVMFDDCSQTHGELGTRDNRERFISYVEQDRECSWSVQCSHRGFGDRESTVLTQDSGWWPPRCYLWSADDHSHGCWRERQLLLETALCPANTDLPCSSGIWQLRRQPQQPQGPIKMHR